MFQPYRGNPEAYTAGPSATVMHDGGVNPIFMTPSGRLLGGPKVVEVSAGGGTSLGGLGLHQYDPGPKEGPGPIMKDQNFPNVSEDQAAEAAGVALPKQRSKLPWVLLGLAAFFLMKPALKG